jgi:hypothetical protein
VAGGGLSAERLKAAVAGLPADLQTKSPLRKVALSRLEAEVAKAAATGRGISRCARGRNRARHP